LTQKNHRISIKLNGMLVAGEAQKEQERQAEGAGRIPQPAAGIPFPFAAESAVERQASADRSADRTQTLPLADKGTPEEKEEGAFPAEEAEESDAALRLAQLRRTMRAADADDPAAYEEPPVWDVRGSDVADWADAPADRGPLRKRNRRLFAGGGFTDRREWLKMLLASLSAVAIGICFGFLALTLFTDDKLRETYIDVLGGTMQTFSAVPDAAPEGQAASPEAETGKAAAEGPTAAAGAGSNTAAPAQPPHLRLYMAQVGAFQDAASAATAIQSLKDRGYPHFLYEQDGRHYLFTAAAPSRDQLLGVAGLLKDQGMEVYVKEITFPPVSGSAGIAEGTAEPAANQPQPALSSLLATGAELVARLSQWSAQQLAGGSEAAPLSAEQEAALQELHRRFLEQNRSLQSSLAENGKTAIAEMVGGLNQAMTALAQARSGQVQPYAWQVQNGVLVYIEKYAALTKQLS